MIISSCCISKNKIFITYWHSTHIYPPPPTWGRGSKHDLCDRYHRHKMFKLHIQSIGLSHNVDRDVTDKLIIKYQDDIQKYYGQNLLSIRKLSGQKYLKNYTGPTPAVGERSELRRFRHIVGIDFSVQFCAPHF
jgi:hypothetical protein